MTTLNPTYIGRTLLAILLAAIVSLVGTTGTAAPPRSAGLPRSAGQPVLHSAAGTLTDLFIEAQDRGQLSQENGDPRVTRARLATVDPGQLGDAGTDLGETAPPASLQLNLFDDAVFTARLDRVTPNPSGGGYVWTGMVEGAAHSTVNLVVKDGLLAGDIWLPQGGVYQIRPATGKLHVIRQINTSVVPDEGDDALTPPAELITQGLRRESPAGAQATTEDGSIIDIMVVYTPGARQAAGGTAGVELEIDANIAISNVSFANSGMSPRLRLVHTAEVDYVEADSPVTDLYRISLKDDGFMDHVHALRDTVHADLVVLLVNSRDGNPRGVAWLLPSLDASWADATGFSVSAVEYSVPFLVVPHEIGHNMGADHDWYADDDPFDQVHTYGHGQVGLEGGWATIMAYRGLCARHGVPCDRLPYWSSPDLTREGMPMGVAPGTDLSCTRDNPNNPPCDADNRLTLSQAASTIANYRRAPSEEATSEPSLRVRLTSEPNRVETTTRQIAYTLELQNVGEAPASGIRISNTIPVETIYVSASAGRAASFSGGQIVWSGLDCDEGDSVTLTFNLEAAGSLHQGDLLINTVAVTANEGDDPPPAEFMTIVSPRVVFLPMVRK